MNKFTEYLEMQIEGCKRTKAPYRDKIIYQLVLDEYKEQLTLTDVMRSDCEIEEIVEQNKNYVLGFYTGDELKEYLSNNYA
jgi:hypothetical protein